jgi:hypothetical protein
MTQEYEPTVITCNSKLRQEKAIAVVSSMAKAMSEFPEGTMFSLNFKIKELTKLRQQKLEASHEAEAKQ